MRTPLTTKRKNIRFPGAARCVTLCATLLLAALCAALGSCRLPSADSLSAIPAGTLRLQFISGSASSRSAVPDLGSSVKVYVATCKNTATGTEVSAESQGTSDCQISNIQPGPINIKVSAYSSSATRDSTTLIATGEATLTLSSGQGANVPITLAMATAGNTENKGAISLEIQWPTAMADAVDWQIDSTAQTSPAVTASGGWSTATLSASSVDSGTRLLALTFRKGTATVGSCIETVNVFNNLTSSKWIDSSGALADQRKFTTDDFMATGTGLSVMVVTGSNCYVAKFYDGHSSETICVPSGTATIMAIPTGTASGQKIQYTWDSTTGIAATGSVLSLPYNGTTASLQLTLDAPNGSTSSTYILTIAAAAAISTPAELAAMASNLSGTYVLTSDINLDGTSWSPVGTYSAVPASTGFTGNFDGGGHTISNLTTTTTNGDAGLFGCIATGAIISNVRLKNVNVSSTGNGSGDDGIGGLVGENYGGTIKRCSVAGTVSGNRRVGGLVGNNRDGSTISECYSTAAVTAVTWAGGLAGSNWATVTDCYTKSTVTAQDFAGGLFGAALNPSAVINCFASGTVLSMSAPADVGGITGTVGGTVSWTACYYDKTQSGCTDAANGSPQTTAEMKVQSTFSGWDFGSIWTINPDRNNGYPYLKALPVADPIVIPSSITAQALHDLMTNNLDGKFILSGSVDLSHNAWTPIGTATSPFTGTFEGNGNTISNFTIDASSGNAGFFAYVGSGGTVSNLHIKDITMTGNSSQVGAIAGNNRGKIYRCSSSGTMTGYSSVGGLVGSNKGMVEECWSNASVTASLFSGGLVGANGTINSDPEPRTGFVKNCYARGNVTVHWGGGLIGSNNDLGSVRNSYAAGSVSFSGVPDTGSYVQVLIGLSGGTQTGCHFDSSKIGATYSGTTTPATTIFGATETTAAMKTQSTYTSDGWDFSNVWTFTAGKNNGYPCLIHNEATTDVSVSSQASLDGIRSNLNGDYVLSGDVTLSGNWTPIGSSGSRFTGTFDGQGHTITGLTISATSGSQALFAETATSAVIMNLGLKDVSIASTSGQYISAIAAVNYGTLYRCWASGTITGEYRIGGLVGENKQSARIDQCYSLVNVVTTTTSYIADHWNIGSLVAGNFGTVKDCYARGTVTGKELRGVGGFMGYNEASGAAINSYATGPVSVTTAYDGPGGFTAKNDGTVTNCFYDNITTLMSDSGKGTGMITTDMKDSAKYTGLDFTNVWGISGSINDGYPYLKYFGSATISP